MKNKYSYGWSYHARNQAQIQNTEPVSWVFAGGLVLALLLYILGAVIYIIG